MLENMTQKNLRSLSSLNVVVVEASAHWQKVLKTVLHGVGIRDPIIVPNITSQMGHLIRKADIMFVDCQLGGENAGFDLVRKIRSMSDPELACTPIIMMDELTTRENILAAIRVGCNEFLEKPIVPARLMSRIKLVIESPRPNVKFGDYHGPDRRRGIDSDYQDKDRRGQSTD